jgi:CHAT domain-containing protein/tetratricopeptide (TPR) repeat protein
MQLAFRSSPTAARGVAHGLRTTAGLVFVLGLCGGSVCHTVHDSAYLAAIDRSDLLATFGACRPFEPRLAGLPYAPLATAPTAATPQMRRQTRRIAAAAWGRASAPALGTYGLLLLVSTHRDEAVAVLAQAARRAPQDAPMLNDLAAAYLSGDSLSHPQDALRALAALDSALTLDPRSAAARFNRALAFERLALLRQARGAWASFLELDRDSAWAAEARRHVHELARPSDVEEWKNLLPAISTAARTGDAVAVRTAVRRFPQLARGHAEEELLPAWARARQNGRSGAAALALARAIGAALAESSGDLMLRDAVAALDGAREAPTLDALAAGYAAYRAALAAAGQRDFRAADPDFARAGMELSRAASPSALWARFHLAHCAYQRQDYPVALRLLGALVGEAEASHYIALAGRARWLTGTVHLVQARPTESLIEYRQALARFERVGERANIVGVHTLLAASLAFVGDADGAWRHRYAALQVLRGLDDPLRLRVTLAEVARAAVEIGEPGVALHFQDELVPIVETLHDPAAMAAALRQRASIYHRLGRIEAALRDLAQAEALVERIRDRDVRLVTAGETLLSEGIIRGAVDAAGALSALDRSLAIQARGNYRFFLPALYLERARLLRRQQAISRATDSLSSGIAECERQRGGVGDQQQRIAYFDQVHALFSEMVAVQIEALHDPAAAFDTTERGRARWLLDQFVPPPSMPGAGGGPLPEPAGVLGSRQLLRELPAGAVVVEYELTRGDLLIWVLSRHGLAFRRAEVDPARLESTAGLLSAAAREGSDARFRTLSSLLHGILIRPIRDLIGSGSLLVFVPAPSLSAVPFGALFDADRERYVIEDWPFVVSPSANVFVRSLRRAESLGGSTIRAVLAVGDPRVRGDLFPELGPLPGAAAEASAVARTLPGGKLLLGEAATRQAFLTSAPRFGLIHFAGHSRENRRDPFLSSLLFAPGDVPGDTGVLYAHELLGRTYLRTRLVVLSSCDSASGSPSRSEGLLGLPLAFLAAGVPAVVASSWPVDDRSGRLFFSLFYRHLERGAGPANALRAACLDLLASPDRSQRSPVAWAGFQLIGAAAPQPTDRAGGAH